MPLPRSSARIIRSIRQISLNKEWVRLRGTKSLPNLTDFEPDGRAGDAVELAVMEVIRDGDRIRFLQHQAGERATRAVGDEKVDRYLDEILPPQVLVAAAPHWNACVSDRLPVYARVETLDNREKPVTLEHLYLPFSANGLDALYMVSSLQVFSEDGSYVIDRLFQRAPLKVEAFLIDPDVTFAEKVEDETGIVLL